MGYFQLSDMRYNDRNVVTKRVSTTVLQLYIIRTPAQDEVEPQTNNIKKTLILDDGMVLDTSLWNNLELIKNNNFF